ncbi:MAG: GNAT family N-acetyltransferase [Spirochaetales bacterium]|nr:GNAT family N-acetyltransferase [Spirochaetales bacterium]
MKTGYSITTQRLGLRRWSGEDLLPFAEMNRNPEVMRYFPKKLSGRETEDFIGAIEKHFDNYGYGLYAADLLEKGVFIGFIGLYTATFESDFTPCPEIGWRLDPRYWGKGYATEGAAACLAKGFSSFSLREIFSFTSRINKPSIAVMKKIGLHYRKSFSHPRITESSELCPHVLYSLRKEEYASAN